MLTDYTKLIADYELEVSRKILTNNFVTSSVTKKKFKINFGISYGENNFLFAKALGGVVGIPYMVLYKPNGEYATHYVGLVPEEMLESDINKVIN